MEYCEKGDLFQRISHLKKNDLTFDEKEVWSIYLQILMGLKELHTRRIFHRDLKSANIFLCKNGTVKIGDMNVSKIAKKGLLYTQTGTPYYASPEVWKDKPYDHKSDMWSLGCIVYEMCALKPPFRAENMEGLYKRVIRGVYDKLPARYSSELSEHVKQLLHLQPSHRSDCAKLLSGSCVREKLEDRFRVESENENNSEFLNTIRIPENLVYLTQNLPKANYEPMRLRRTVPPLGGSTEMELEKPVKNVFLSLNVMSDGKVRSRERALKPPTHLPVLKNHNLNKIRLPGGSENTPGNIVSNHLKLKSIDHKKRVELLMNKHSQIASLDQGGHRRERVAFGQHQHKGLKNIKLDPIK